MKRAIWIFIATAALALVAQAATVGSWKHGYSGSGNMGCSSMRNPGDVCAWTGASGNSPVLETPCPKVIVTTTGTLSVKPYGRCTGSTLATCKQLEMTNDRVGGHGAVTLDATDWYAKGIPFGNLVVEYVSGSGDAIVECGG